jgi:hypothetical protein
MEDVKKVVPQKKAVVRKPIKKGGTIIQANLARGLFLTGFLGIVFFGLITFEILNPASGIPEQLLENNVEMLQTSVGLFLIGLFSFTKR